MEEARRIFRRAIFAFLQSYHCFTARAVILVLPFSAAILLSQMLVLPSSPIMATIQTRLGAVFVASGLPATSDLFSVLNLKFSQTIVSFFLTLPFSLTFLLFAKASVIKLVGGFSGRRDLYFPLLRTHLCGVFIVLSANAAALSVLFVSFNVAYFLGFQSETAALCVSAAGAIVYSVVLAQSLVICNMGVIVSGMENRAGFLAILRGYFLLRGRMATALTLTLAPSMLMAATEALFHLRVTRPYRAMAALTPSIVGEGFTIAYIYSMIVVLDITASCMFYKSCWMSGSEMELGCSCGGGIALEHDKKGKPPPQR